MKTGSDGAAAPWSVLRTTVAEGCQAPAPRGGHTATLIEKNLLIQGGQQHKSAGVFEYFSLNPVVLNTETHQWFEPRTALGKGPINRAYHTTTQVGTSLIIFGGSSKAQKKGGKPVMLGDMPVVTLRVEFGAPALSAPMPRPTNSAAARLDYCCSIAPQDLGLG